MRKVRLHDNPGKATADRMVIAIKAGLGPRTLVAITWVRSSTGTRSPGGAWRSGGRRGPFRLAAY
ncbi:hypothetical protein [Streptosporangium sp. NPDC003464]